MSLAPGPDDAASPPRTLADFVCARPQCLDDRVSAFRGRVAAVARTVRDLAVRPGDRVAVLLPHGEEQAAWILGAACSGAIAVPIAPKLKDRQVRHVVADAEPTLVVIDRTRRAGLLDPDALLAMAETLGARLVDPSVTAEASVTPTLDDVADLPLPGDPAVLLYTSGSTGRPKGIVQSHRSLADGARIVSGYLGLGSDDRVLGVLPLSFDYGLNQVLGALWVGCEFVLREYLAVGDLVVTLRRSGATVLAGVPPLWIALADAIEQDVRHTEGLEHLRLITNTGGRLPERVVRSLRQHLPAVDLWSMYGLSEAFRSAALQPALVDERPTSIGTAIPEVELLVLGEDGASVGAGEVGELVHCGALVADGYWRRPEDTQRVFRPDPRPDAAPGARAVWSGDLVRRDRGGYLEFIARKDEQVKIRGWRISLEEVLDVVRDVAGVAAAVAFGYRPEDAEESELVVFVEPSNPSSGEPLRGEDVLASCRRELPAPMVPGRIEIVDALPRSPHGKFDLQALRARLEGAAGPK